jgi:glycosyltransferase involved in cell wall biosynthesis
MATLFIGMPVYNGEKFIGCAIESLISQTFSDWTLLISDNASQDSTASICDMYCKKDERIHYIRQAGNIGAIGNFVFLLRSANTPLFMWAASDDEWKSEFVEACITGMNSKNADWAFTNIVNIDTFGRIIREYGSFVDFAGDDPSLRVTNYVLSPEVFGKANLIYSIYRLSRLKELMLELLSSPFAESYGYDMAFNLGILCRAKLYVDERVLFRKRHVRVADMVNEPDVVVLDRPYVNGTINTNDFPEYKRSILEVSKGTEFEALVRNLMEYRHKFQKDHNKEMAIRVEEATWKFARWAWLKNSLKFIYSLVNKSSQQSALNNDESK